MISAVPAVCHHELRGPPQMAFRVAKATSGGTIRALRSRPRAMAPMRVCHRSEQDHRAARPVEKRLRLPADLLLLAGGPVNSQARLLVADPPVGVQPNPERRGHRCPDRRSSRWKRWRATPAGASPVHQRYMALAPVQRPQNGDWKLADHVQDASGRPLPRCPCDRGGRAGEDGWRGDGCGRGLSQRRGVHEGERTGRPPFQELRRTGATIGGVKRPARLSPLTSAGVLANQEWGRHPGPV